MASIIQRGDSWRAVVRRVGSRTITKTFKRKVDAQAWARGVEADIDRGRSGQADRSVRVSDLLTRFRDEVAPLRKGERWETVRINFLLREAAFTKKRLVDLTPADVRAWRDERLRSVSPASVNREMNLLSSVLTFACKEWGYDFRNPVFDVKRPSGADRARDRRWPETDIAKFLNAARFDESRPPETTRDYAPWALLLAIETAMRAGELCSLRVGDVNLTQRYATVRDSKNGDPRDVPLTKRAGELLIVLVAGREADERVFPLSSDSLGKYFRQIRNQSGLADIHFHDCRHEAASRLSQKLPNVLELAAVTGHRSLKSLQRYVNLSAADLAQKLD